MNREIVKELIQHKCTASSLKKELNLLITDVPRHKQLIDDYDHLRTILGGGGASKKVAQSLLKTIRKA